ncbi:MAG: RluA family pseudouridine synthase [Sphingopyxis sp.]|nr:RluA family pseudouridine synthase [Sphingopyxis sp.]
MSATDPIIIADEDDGIRLDRWFKRHREGTPHALLARWARSGLLTLDGKKADVSDRIAAGQVLVAPQPPAPAAPRPRASRAPLSDADIAFAETLVIHRDASALVLDKPPGLATQGGTKTSEHVDGLLDALKGDAPVRPKLVHRLDKDTSGALLVARTPRAAAFFSKAFSNRSARKTYWAIVVGVPAVEAGEINLPLAKQPGTGGEKMHVSEAAGQPALTRYRVLDRAGNEAAWVELHPLTGRTHQLRVHMAAIGHPIVGDGKYGGKAAFLTGTISRKLHLHARRLRIDHPDGGKLDIAAELPDHFAASMASLGFDPVLGDTPDPGEIAAAVAPRAIAKVKAKAHAKQLRKARRGERRGRAEVKASRPGKPRKPAPKKPPKKP